MLRDALSMLQDRKTKWNNYMREYRKRDYVKKYQHEYYLRRIIRQAAEDNKGKNVS